MISSAWLIFLFKAEIGDGIDLTLELFYAMIKINGRRLSHLDVYPIQNCQCNCILNCIILVEDTINNGFDSRGPLFGRLFLAL